jgi:hypothetical protein
VEGFWKKQFIHVAKNPMAWVMVAEDLKEAANVLLVKVKDDWQRPLNDEEMIHSISPIYLMLAGLAIENLVKAIYIHRQYDVINDESGQLKKWGGNGHKIADMVRALQVSLNHKEWSLLERLQVHIEWAGRYPIPKNYVGLLPKKIDSGDILSLKIFSSREPEIIRQLFVKLERLLDDKKY